MNNFDEILRLATGSVGADYFNFRVAQGGIYFRERVYCYELYHQMRSGWPPKTEYRLNGEVDKRSHPLIRGNPIPDFIVHKPGITSHDYAVIEVKSASAVSPNRVMVDIKKFRKFLDFGYKRAIYLIYGSANENRIQDLVDKAAINHGGTDRIEIWLHAKVGHPAEMCSNGCSD